MSGKFITLEGIDGSGKTTQGYILENELRKIGKEVIFTREPGGVPGAEEIRELLVQGEKDRWSNITELLLFLQLEDIILKKYYFQQLKQEKL